MIQLITDILSTAGNNSLFTFVLLLGLYTIKGFVWIIPIQPLYLAAGAVFGLWKGIAVSVAGICICLMEAYAVGRCYSGEKIRRFTARHRKLQLADSFETANAFFFSYIARIIGIIPCDVVSAYCGIKRLPVTDYLAGSVLGMLPGLFMTGLLGASIRNPASPRFVISAVFHIVTIIFSFFIYNKLKKGARNEHTCNP